MKFSLFMNIKAKQGVQCTPKALAEVVNGEAYLKAVAELQAATNEEEERKAKNKLPVVTYNAFFDGKERKNANAQPSGLFFSDYDGIDDPGKLYAEKICGRCDELGILRVEVSIRQHGLHLITECRPGLKTIAEHQRWLDKQLGLQCDKACKDLARASYVVPEAFVLYERGALWNGEPKAVVENPALGRETKCGSSVKTLRATSPNLTDNVEPQDFASPNSEMASDEMHHGVSPQNNAEPNDRDAVIARLETIPYNPEERFGTLLYSDILRQFWKSELGKEAPLKGERHASLMEWARQVCYFTDFDLELMKRVTPTLGISEHELAEIIYDTLRWRDEHKTPLTPSKLKRIVRGMEVAQRALTRDVPTEDNASMDEGNEVANGGSKTTPEPDDEENFFDQLPSLPIGMRESVLGVPKKSRMSIVVGIMPFMEAYATDVRVRYCDGKLHRLNGMSIVYGMQASGKSAVKDAVSRWLKPMLDADAEARRREDAYKQLKKSRKANEKLPDEPHEIIRVVPITISCSSLLKREKNAQGQHLVSFGEELDTLVKTNASGSWSQKYDVYRLSYDNGMWGQDYNGDQAESGMVSVAYNFTVLGTEGSVKKCFRNDNIENGMCGRVFFNKMPSGNFEYMPVYKEPRPEYQEKVNEACGLLAGVKGEVEMPKLCKAIKKWCNQKADEARESNDIVVDVFRKRAAVIGFRYAVVYHILESQGNPKKLGKESDNVVKFAIVIAECALKNQCELFGVQLLESRNGINMGYRTRNKELFSNLPNEFTLSMVQALRPDMSTEAIRQTIYRWSKEGNVKNIAKKTWAKTLVV